jgi:hypothetical protein
MNGPAPRREGRHTRPGEAGRRQTQGSNTPATILHEKIKRTKTRLFVRGTAPQIALLGNDRHLHSMYMVCNDS